MVVAAVCVVVFVVVVGVVQVSLGLYIKYIYNIFIIMYDYQLISAIASIKWDVPKNHISVQS